MTTQNHKLPEIGSGIYHPGARAMQIFTDDEDCLWLCDKGVDPQKGFKEQGCWRCRELPFTRND